jgi:hypothetical protein
VFQNPKFATSDTSYNLTQALNGRSSNAGEITTWFVTLGEGAYQNDFASLTNEVVYTGGNALLFGMPGLLSDSVGVDTRTPFLDSYIDQGYAKAEDLGVSRGTIDTAASMVNGVLMLRDVKDLAAVGWGIVKSPGKIDDPVSGIGGNSTSTEWSVTGNSAGDGVDVTAGPPNPYGKHGSPRHQAHVEDEVRTMQTTYAGNPDVEVRTELRVVGQDGKVRYIDAQAVDRASGDIVDQVQVGRTNKNGTPVIRERRAMEDIDPATGFDTRYRAYDQ